jgi:lysophospholipase L1-like esterase
MKTAFAIKHLALLSAKRMLLPLCAFALSGATATAAAYTQLYVIGHSLSMTNSGGYPGYWGNGMSNGPMWPEYLAGRLGISYSPEDNTAVGSAATFELTDDDGTVLPGLQDQIAKLPTGNKSRSVIVLWLGTNDLQLVFSGYPATETISQAISNIQDGIENLYALGFRAVIVPNVFRSYTDAWLSRALHRTRTKSTKSPNQEFQRPVGNDDCR